MTKLRIFLDVDGVLNAVHFNDPPNWGDWKVKTCNNYKIRHSQKMADRLFVLRSDDVEIIWVTTWAVDANRWIGPLFGWPNLPVGGTPDYNARPWWKFTVVKDLYDIEPLPFVWLDDDLGEWDDGAFNWVQTLNGLGLAIAPQVDEGLTESHLTEIEDFVRDWV